MAIRSQMTGPIRSLIGGLRCYPGDAYDYIDGGTGDDTITGDSYMDSMRGSGGMDISRVLRVATIRSLVPMAMTISPVVLGMIT